jgi:Flp pilus assembly protein TadD
MSDGLCPEPELNAILEGAGRGDPSGLAQVEAGIARYGRDARLYFLKGSLLASQQMYQDAQAAMMRALQISPEYWIARFQLGLLQMTSGDADGARETWSRLQDLPEGHYIKTMARGLEALIDDDFAAATSLLEQGVAANTEMPPINNDMQIVLASLKSRVTANETQSASEDFRTSAEPVSAAHFLLNVFKQKGRPN